MIFFVYGVLLIVAYILKGTFVHEWYKPLYLLPITLYIVTLISKIEKNHVYILALLLMIPFYRSFLTHLNYTFTDKISKPAARVNQYLDIADKLFKKYPNEVLLTSEIGGLGYAFRGRILDGMGLIQPDCLKYHPMAIPEERSNGAIGAIPTRCVEEQMPGIIVSYDVFIQHFSKQPLSTTKYNVYKLNNFKREHMKLYKDTNMWGSKNLNVYIKKDIDEGL